MNKILYCTTVILLASFFNSSCVTKKKYDELNLKKVALETEKNDCEEKLKAAEAERDRLNALSTKLDKELTQVIADTIKTGALLRETLKNHKALNESYEKLLKSHDRLKSTSTAEASKLSADLAKREKELLESERKIGELTANLTAREARVKELEKVLAEKEQAVNDLKAKVTKA
ncbi:MAG: hypothetical protein K2X86_06515, partial [Cytophagaceae bacterium]|nr:hypothetical protein [Cytophagaceae bacterium]